MMTNGSVCEGNEIAFVGKSTWESSQSPGRPAEINLLELLIELTRSNDRLVDELATAQQRLGQAIDYAGDSRSRAALGKALVVHARKRQMKVAAQLRANRAKALALLAELASSRGRRN